jgi:glycosyltransferase involved in cell wall biosynthesis
MSKPLPKVSLVTPIFNGAKYLPEVLASIRAQNYPGLEYIVCDGGSTDGTIAILEANRDLISHLLIGKDRGMYDAINKGFKIAQGEVLGWINSDDVLMPWCLRCVGEYFRAVPECEWVTGIPSVMDAESRLAWVANVAPQYRRQWIAKGWYSGLGLGTIQQESTFFSRTLLNRVGGLNADLKWGGDLDLWRRFAKSGANLHQAGTVLSGFRQHGSNASAVHSARYYSEGGAKRIPGGRLIGYSYSFLRLLIDRSSGRRRLLDILMPPNQ